MAESLMLQAADAAAFLGIPKSTLLRETRARRIPFKQIGQRYWYHRATLENYAATMDGGPSEHPSKTTGKRHNGVRLLRGYRT